MRKEKLHRIIIEKAQTIKIVLGIVFVIAAIIAIKTYTNYSAIIQEIKKTNDEIANLELQIAYSKNFYEKYLDSEYASYFLAHKNNSLFDGEKIIRLIYEEDEIIPGETDTNDSTGGIDVSSPQKARIQFFKSKIK